MQQRLGLATALLGDPALVILDEPTSALDPVGRDDVRAIIREAQARGSAVLLNSHLLGEVERLCDRVAIVNQGRVVAAGSLTDLLGETAVRLRVTDLPRRRRRRSTRFGPVERRRRGLAHRARRGGPTACRTLVAARRRRGRPDPRRRPRPPLARGPVPRPRRGSGERGMSARARCSSIAGLTLREMARRRVLWVLLGLVGRERGARRLGVDRLVDAAPARRASASSRSGSA